MPSEKGRCQAQKTVNILTLLSLFLSVHRMFVWQWP